MTSQTIQQQERRSILLYSPSEGYRSLPVNIDRTVFAKTKEEKAELSKLQRTFKYNGLKQWNERNRPGNNK